MRMRKKKSSLSLSLPFIEGGVSSWLDQLNEWLRFTPTRRRKRCREF
jgi:hypothetical protein